MLIATHYMKLEQTLRNNRESYLASLIITYLHIKY